MNRYILDTNVLIDMKRGTSSVREGILQVGPENCYVSSISIAELQTGYEITKNEDELQNINFCKERFKIIPVTEDILNTFAKMKAVQIRAGKKVPDFDLTIAATAKALNYTVVSHDEKHFSVIEGIKWEDWGTEIF